MVLLNEMMLFLQCLLNRVRRGLIVRHFIKKYIRIKVLLFILIFQCISCSNNNNNIFLSHMTIELCDDFVGYGGTLSPCENGIIGIEYAKSFPPLFQLKIEKEEFVMKRIGNRGQGPNEFINPITIQNLNNSIYGVMTLTKNLIMKYIFRTMQIL